jgi:diguanylate cyclase (GGDEF)-like protein
MSATRRDLLLGIGLIAFLVVALWGAVFVASYTVNQLLYQDAEGEGESWAHYLATNVKDLEAIARGAPPSAESMSFFEKAQKVGDVFRYRIYDAEGHLRLSSDALDRADETSTSIPVHNPEAAEAVLDGDTVVEVKSGAEEEEEEEQGRRGEEGEAASGEHPAFFSEAYVPVFSGGKIIGIVEAYVDQSEKRAAFHARVEWAALALAGIIGVAYGIPALGFYWRTRQKRQAESRADFLAHHDPLTGLLNRARFMRDLDTAVSLGCPVAVHAVDVDRFKEINDTLGHAAGDEILKEIARRLETLSDSQDLLARLGADEFALAQIIRDPQQIDVFARRLVAALREPFHLKDQDIESSACVGTALAPEHGTDADSLVKSADLAISHCKSEGAGSHSLFRPQMDAELQARRELEAMLRRAVSNNGFELHFQPIRRAADNGLAGFEALLRLPKKDGGHVSPVIFVPLAERLGLINTIGDWVIRRSCEIAATWPDDLSVAVNLSPAQFEDGRIAASVHEALQASGLLAGRLEMEITEGLLLSRTERTMRQLADLKALGVRIAMDDFGTGYSSLSYLWKFPFDKLKIDQSFVGALQGEDDHLASVIRTIVALGRSLGMTITAEGVETEAQAEFLRRVGCDELQGFHLGRPMPLEQLPVEILRGLRSTIHEMSVSEAHGLSAALQS